MDQDDLLRQTILRLRYEEAIDTGSGERPQARIDELTVDTPQGGSESIQHSLLYPLGCKHVGRKATAICRHNNTCCEECRCIKCAWGLCQECKGVRTNEGDICRWCEALEQEQREQAQLEAMFGACLQAIGMSEESDANVS